METKRYYAIGLMSGTSLDGLDIAYCEFQQENSTWNFKILDCETIPYSTQWEERLRNSIFLKSEDLLQLHSDYGFYLGKTVQDFMERNALYNIDVVASHGHTVFHQPQKRFTLQIGDGRAIKSIINKTVIYDFRSQDVLLGGNGAPLVPIGDELLFSNFDTCLNLGGFSNISLKREGKRIAFDICPVNIIINEYAQKLGYPFDKDGELANMGTIDENLLMQLNQLEFYQKEAPKSLGIEWINAHIRPLIMDQNPQNLIATFTEHATIQIAKTLEQYKVTEVLVTGGGAYNKYLIKRLKTKTKASIHIPEKEIIEYKEALIFAFMGVLRHLGLNNILSSATGSRCDHSSGLIC